jgi:hypothetical protein
MKIGNTNYDNKNKSTITNNGYDDYNDGNAIKTTTFQNIPMTRKPTTMTR